MLHSNFFHYNFIKYLTVKILNTVNKLIKSKLKRVTKTKTKKLKKEIQGLEVFFLFLWKRYLIGCLNSLSELFVGVERACVGGRNEA